MRMTGRAHGPPFRFVYLVLALWVAGRTASYFIESGGAHNGPSAPKIANPESHADHGARIFSFQRPPAAPAIPIPERIAPPAAPIAPAAATPANDAPRRDSSAAAPVGKAGVFNRPPASPPLVPVTTPPLAPAMNRWSLSAWLLYRPHGSSGALASGGQLGASQAGARLSFDLTPSAASALSLHARISGALQRPTEIEGAMGLTWQPSRALPLAFSIERRIALADGGRDAFAAYAAGGIGPTHLARALIVEGYAQAGLVGLRHTDPFVDGRLAMGLPLGGDGDEGGLIAGAALSGGAQPGAARLDVGPQLSARLPVPGAHVRMVVEWRQRVAGRALPASGPAIILASDF